jgi:hypothetical protein
MALTKPNTKQIDTHPDAKKHRYVSFIKSAVRIAAFGFLAYYDIQLAAVLLIVAEVIGIAEELV